MQTSSVVLLHDNVHLHMAACSQALLKHFNWDLFDHPPYSPDQTPSNYHPFTHVRHLLDSPFCNNNEMMMEGGKTWQSTQAQTFLTQAYKNVCPEYDRYLISSSDYVEK
jgi:hypothetical protein